NGRIGGNRNLRCELRNLGGLCVASGTALPQHDHGAHGERSPYAGMETREIKSLSASDIEELRSGGGWGLALPAELNGVPGPRHLLELKEEIALSAEQVTQVEALFEAMRTEAIPAGERLIEAEAAIEQAFAERNVDADSLRRLLQAAESARTELRFIHLSQHYKTLDLLHPEQIARYKVLRGYADDPCDNVPEGHDPARYRRHMGCD
ncbi:MAG: Spy/CpxP family protein refolding chaperone, partial [Ectothiorhodospiraceae bacterium]|nr:Spy/CpxP family protein refolding chaperone [Ectothiorhodospiraceae bacterium]